MQVELRPLDSNKSYANNPRLNAATVDAAASIRAFVSANQASSMKTGHCHRPHAQQGRQETGHGGGSAVHVAVGLTTALLKAYRIAEQPDRLGAAWTVGYSLAVMKGKRSSTTCRPVPASGGRGEGVRPGEARMLCRGLHGL